MDGNLNKYLIIQNGNLLNDGYVYVECVLICSYFQLINIGSQYNYGNNGHSEFLCVVSREFGVSNSYKETESTDRAKVIVLFIFLFNLKGLFLLLLSHEYSLTLFISAGSNIYHIHISLKNSKIDTFFM